MGQGLRQRVTGTDERVGWAVEIPKSMSVAEQVLEDEVIADAIDERDHLRIEEEVMP